MKLPVVHIPHQTSIGFEVVVPTKEDANDLVKFLERSGLGRARTRQQPVFSLKAVELKWTPTGTMPPLKKFADVVRQWAHRKGYELARDMRELKRGLDTMRNRKLAARVAQRFASIAV